jgi:predicted  nucleic acid-binding Zn-ribbon protein
VKFASENAAKKKLEKTLEVEKAAHKATEKTVAAAKAAKEEAEKKLAAEQKSAAARADQLDALHKKEVQVLEKQVRWRAVGGACCGVAGRVV